MLSLLSLGVNHGNWLILLYQLVSLRDPSSRMLMMVWECTGTCYVPFVGGSVCFGS
jgi:hypothetical protein